MWGFALLPLDKDFDVPLPNTLRFLDRCGSKWKPSKTGFIMGNEFEKNNDIISNFLELLGFDELIVFKSSMEEECHDIDKASFWYRRRIGSKMMGFKEKTALMIATMFESKGVLNYILETSFIDVNQASGLDRFLHFICCCCGLRYIR